MQFFVFLRGTCLLEASGKTWAWDCRVSRSRRASHSRSTRSSKPPEQTFTSLRISDEHSSELIQRFHLLIPGFAVLALAKSR